MSEDRDMKGLALFLFEAGMLKKLKRTGYPFLGSGGESIADHCFRAALVGYILGLGAKGADASRVALMLLVHDLPEARTGDLNYVNKRYCTAHEEKAAAHQRRNLPPEMAREVAGLTEEFNRGDSLEAKLARDADQIDMILELKEQHDLGNPQAMLWIEYAIKRLSTEAARELAHSVLTTQWTEWWFEKREDLWVKNGNQH